MSEKSTVQQLRDVASSCRHRDMPWVTSVLLDAAATIEALQRQLDDVIDTLENWVPSSECSVMEIAQARACGRMLVSTNNLGIVKRPNTQLAAKPPASVDTTKARLHAGTLRGTKEGRLLHQLADALDASRAECERLREALSASASQVVALRSICPWCDGDMQDGICQTCGYTRIEAARSDGAGQ